MSLRTLKIEHGYQRIFEVQTGNQAHNKINRLAPNPVRFTNLLGQEILVDGKHKSIKVTGRDGAETFRRVFKERKPSLDEKESGSHSFGSRTRHSRKKGQDAQLPTSCSS